MEVKWNGLGKHNSTCVRKTHVTGTSHCAWFCFCFHQGKTRRAKNQKGKMIYQSNQGRLWGPIRWHHRASLSALPTTLTWCDVIVGTFRAEPSWTGQQINPNNQPFTQRLFFYWIGNWKNETVLKAGQIPGFTHDRILYDRGRCAPDCHYLQSLFTAFGYKCLWKRQHMLGEEEPGAL